MERLAGMGFDPREIRGAAVELDQGPLHFALMRVLGEAAQRQQKYDCGKSHRASACRAHARSVPSRA
jgi:hypothetical protein